ncbi:hypothetical protein BH20BAC1_BH20BAC1_03870 [soil metagenome]
MANSRKISQPTQGSESVGTQTGANRQTGTPSAGTRTQTKIAASGSKESAKKKKPNVNDDELVVKNKDGKSNLEKRPLPRK